jgi:hypothetical protein
MRAGRLRVPQFRLSVILFGTVPVCPSPQAHLMYMPSNPDGNAKEYGLKAMRAVDFAVAEVSGHGGRGPPSRFTAVCHWQRGVNGPEQLYSVPLLVH